MKTIVTLTLDHAELDMDTIEMFKRHLTAARLHAMETPPWAALERAVRQSAPTCVEVATERGWTAGWNIPGCLPDEVPQVFDSREDAIQYLIDELENAHRQEMELFDLAVPDDVKRRHQQLGRQYLEARAQLINLKREDNQDPFWVAIEQYVWWVAPEQQ